MNVEGGELLFVTRRIEPVEVEQVDGKVSVYPVRSRSHTHTCDTDRF